MYSELSVVGSWSAAAGMARNHGQSGNAARRMRVLFDQGVPGILFSCEDFQRKKNLSERPFTIDSFSHPSDSKIHSVPIILSNSGLDRPQLRRDSGHAGRTA